MTLIFGGRGRAREKRGRRRGSGGGEERGENTSGSAGDEAIGRIHELRNPTAAGGLRRTRVRARKRLSRRRFSEFASGASLRGRRRGDLIGGHESGRLGNGGKVKKKTK